MADEPRRYDFAAFVEAKRREDGIPIDLPDGSSIVVPPAILWPEESYDAMFRGDMAEATRAFLGDEQYGRLLANGGTWRIVNAILEDFTGTTPGESSASSTT